MSKIFTAIPTSSLDSEAAQSGYSVVVNSFWMVGDDSEKHFANLCATAAKDLSDLETATQTPIQLTHNDEL